MDERVPALDAQTDAAATGSLEDPEPGSQPILRPEDVPALDATYPRELVFIPEWQRSVWVWAYDLAGERDRWADMQAGTDEADRINRGMIARVIAAVRQGGDMINDQLPPPLFNRADHWGFLSRQPIGVLRRICEVSERLNGESMVTQEQIAGFFVMMAMVVPCLKRLGSHCGACTDCPQNSREACPSELSRKLWLPTV